jgi:catechol 2,3-dioxygenase-like lactoylglutathione lyase family enzyme
VIVERTDFVSVPVTDMERAKRFYGETLGLVAFFRDPDGTALMLHRRYAPRTDDSTS